MEDMEKWRKASRIAAEALDYGKGLIKKNASYMEVTEKIEKRIFELGGKPAFPVQMSLNDVAAHFTLDPGEDIKLYEHLVNLDVGVHVDGCIGDTALTVDLSGQHAELVKASREALDMAIRAAEEGAALGEIGRAIHDTITSYGFSPVKNLSGHGLSSYNIHDKPSIPNFDTGDKTRLGKGFYAIEPFATNGAGMIYESGSGTIFSLIQKKPARGAITRRVLQEIDSYQGLPFCTRWLAKKFPIGQLKFALRELLKLEVIREYPPLPDKNRGLVSQAEHTILVGERVEVLTKL